MQPAGEEVIMSLSDSLYDSARDLEKGEIGMAHSLLAGDLETYSVEPWDYLPEHLAAVRAIVDEIAVLIVSRKNRKAERAPIVEKMDNLRLTIEGFGRADGKGYDGWFRLASTEGRADPSAR